MNVWFSMEEAMQDETEIIYNAPVRVRYSHGLPHWEVDGGLYAVTFRLFDSLPRDPMTRALQRMRARVQRNRRQGRHEGAATARDLHHVFLEEIDRPLDRGLGACWLQRPTIAQLVCSAIEYYDTDKYELLVYVVMGNHVHIVFRLFKGKELASAIGNLKSYTGLEANRIVGRTGQTFWRRGYYDHLIRTVEELHRTVKYVWENPDNAGLEEWAWRRRYPERTRCFV